MRFIKNSIVCQALKISYKEETGDIMRPLATVHFIKIKILPSEMLKPVVGIWVGDHSCTLDSSPWNSSSSTVFYFGLFIRTRLPVLRIAKRSHSHPARGHPFIFPAAHSSPHSSDSAASPPLFLRLQLPFLSSVAVGTGRLLPCISFFVEFNFKPCEGRTLLLSSSCFWIHILSACISLSFFTLIIYLHIFILFINLKFTETEPCRDALSDYILSRIHLISNIYS